MITKDEIVSKLEEIVASKPEGYMYVYDPKAIEKASSLQKGDSGFYNVRTDDSGRKFAATCYYRFLDQTPGCIVGQLIAAYKPDWEFGEGNTAYQESRMALDIDEDTAYFLDVVQHHQDSGSTWSESLKAAKNGLLNG